MVKEVVYAIEGLEGSVAIATIKIAAKMAKININYKNAKELSFKINSNDKITTSLSIYRYLAEASPSAQLYGLTLYDEAQVNQYLEIFWNDLELAVYYTIANPNDSHNFDNILKVIDDILTTNSYLVSNNITLADIYLYSILSFSKNNNVLIDVSTKYQSISRWYNTIEKNVV